MKEWAKHAGVEPDRISVAWVRRGHPWAARWQLDCETEKALAQSGICWLQVPHPDDHADDWKSPLCDEHQKVDQRWAHAKLYELRAGAWRRLLITSANLSRAAWGDPRDGGLVIDNFELGVLLRVQEGFGDRLRGGAFDHATCHVDYDRPIEASIAWLAAEWDGKELTVECRTTPGATLASQIDVTVARTSAKRMPVTWASGTPTGCTARWPPRDGVPVLICVRTTVGCIRRIAVRDVRPTDNGQILCGEFDEEQLREERDRLLEERYGYAPAPETRGTSPNENRRTATVANGADYAVPAYVDARRRFQLVDNWWKELQDAGDRARPFILNDGRRIRELWTAIAESGADRGIRVAARVAADELRCRIQRHEREH